MLSCWKNSGVFEIRIMSIQPTWSTHTRHLLNAYVHGQLTDGEREQVARHVRMCAYCREALDREERLARDLIKFMPQIGQSDSLKIAKLWPAVWSELRAPLTKNSNRLPKLGMVLAVILLCVFVSSMFFTGSAQALAASSRPLQFIPAEIQPTWTPARTDNPSIASTTPQASETTRAFDSPRPSPLPFVKNR